MTCGGRLSQRQSAQPQIASVVHFEKDFPSLPHSRMALQGQAETPRKGVDAYLGENRIGHGADADLGPAREEKGTGASLLPFTKLCSVCGVDWLREGRAKSDGGDE